MKWLMLIVALALPGCADTPGEKAEKAYEVASGAVIDQARKKCRAASEAAQAFAEEGDREKYSHWELKAYNDCVAAEHGLY